MTASLWNAQIVQNIADQQGWILHASEEINSTNMQLMELARHSLIHRHWAITKLQHKGKGRRGNAWNTAVSHALLMSFGWKLMQPLDQISSISLVTGLSVLRALLPITKEIRLKWPNDLLLQGKKIAGILIETAEYSKNSTTLVIGVGLNWYTPSQEELPQSIGLDALKLKLTQDDCHQALQHILEQLNKDLHQFGADGFAPFRYDWNLYHAWAAGTPVSWQDKQGLCYGFIDKVDDSGQLWVTEENGTCLPLGEQAYSVRLKACS